MTESNTSQSNEATPTIDGDETPSEPLNRAERRAAKRNKGKNRVKGVSSGMNRQKFTPKDIKVAGHKEFINRKSG